MKKLQNLIAVAALVVTAGEIKAQPYWSNTSATASTVETTTTGDCTIGNNLTVNGGVTNLNASGPSPATSNIRANTTNGLIGMYTNTYSNDGPGIEMYGTSHTYAPYRGKIHFSSIGDDLTTAAASFVNYTPLTGIYHYNLTLSKGGEMIVGGDLSLSDIVPGDVLTVKNNIGLWAANDNDGRQVHGNSLTGYLGMYSNTYSNNGSSVEVFGSNHATFPGKVHVCSNGSTTNEAAVSFVNYDPATSIYHDNVTISKGGEMIVGSDLNLSHVVPGDVLTVKNNIGLWALNDNDGRQVHGNSLTGYLGMYSNTYSNNGSSVEVFGSNHSTFPGKVHLCSNGSTTGEAAVSFVNYDPLTSTYHDNVTISKGGEMIVGSDLSLSDVTSGDVLTVKNSIGFVRGATTPGREIHGNTNNGYLGMYADNGPADGSANVEVYGPAHSSFDGQVHYNAYGAGSGRGHVFQTYYFSGGVPAWTPRMVVAKDGKVAIGSGLIGSGNTPGDYLLYVEKGILTEHVRVAAQSSTSWADFVFNDDYNLMELPKVEAYVKEHKHLPEIPSAADVQNNGIDLAEIDAKLLQKIEELTLYVIDQQKRIDKLEKRLKNK